MPTYIRLLHAPRIVVAASPLGFRASANLKLQDIGEASCRFTHHVPEAMVVTVFHLLPTELYHVAADADREDNLAPGRRNLNNIALPSHVEIGAGSKEAIASCRAGSGKIIGSFYADNNVHDCGG